MTISIGDKLPQATFKTKNASEMVDATTSDIFDGKKVVLFAVPGAFTPTCHLNHLPGYLEHHDALKANGVDTIAVVAVNDAFVVSAWADATGGEDKLTYLSDWDASFTKAVGLDKDLSVATLGVRSNRYAMVVNDGVVEALHVEDNPGEATSSSAASILDVL